VCGERVGSRGRAVPWSRGVLPCVVGRCVGSRNLVNEEALAHWGGGGAFVPQTNKQLNLNDDLFSCAAVRLGRVKSSLEQRK